MMTGLKDMIFLLLLTGGCLTDATAEQTTGPGPIRTYWQSLTGGFNKGAKEMNDLNSIVIEGVLHEDPLISRTGGAGQCLIKVTRRSSRKDSGIETSVFTVTAHGPLADACKRLGHKGRGVRVVGRLKEERWETARGETRSRVVIEADHIEFRPEQEARAE
jgi:single-strand DNA-binding protein